MGVHNGAGRVDQSIRSITAQTFSDWEFIICDDGSDDDTFSKLLAWRDQDPRIIPIRNEANKGLAATLNHCLEHASGEYVARMDDDDISLPNRFDIQVDFLDQYPEYALIGGAIALFDDRGVWGHYYMKKRPDKIDIYKGKSFCHPSVMIRRDALTAVGGYTVTSMTLRVEDYDSLVQNVCIRVYGRQSG